MEQSKVPGPPIGYVDLLNYATAEANKKAVEDGSEFQRTPIRPSAAGQCTRELYYALMQFHGKATYAVEPRAPEVTRLFGLGHSIEYHVIKQFEQYLEAFEVKYKQQVLDFGPIGNVGDAMYQRLEGSIDACFISKEWKAVIDFKSKKDKYSSYRNSQWTEMSDRLASMSTVRALSDDAFWVEDLGAFLTELRDPFFEANFVQLNLYACSSFLQERGIDHGAIIQYNKNDSRLREVRFKPSMEVAARTVAKFKTAVAAAEIGIPAPRDHQLGSMKCAFCPYSKECWDGDNSLQAWFKTFPAKQWPTDLNRMGDVGLQLEALFDKLGAVEPLQAARARTEEEIISLLSAQRVSKIRTKSGDVYELKHLKSPRPRIELRRSKA